MLGKEENGVMPRKRAEWGLKWDHQQRLERRLEEGKEAEDLEDCDPGRRNTICKGPGAGMSLGC